MQELEQKDLLPLTPVDRQEKQLIEAGYNVDKKVIPDGSLFLEAFDPKKDFVDKTLRKITFEYDATGQIFKRFFVTETPYELNYDKEKVLM